MDAGENLGGQIGIGDQRSHLHPAAAAYFNGAIYYGSVGSNLRRFTISNATVGCTPASRSAGTFTYPGTFPSISANGAADPNAIVWAYENTSTAVLHAYLASDLTQELYNSNQATGGKDHFGTGNKYIAPTIANGKVYVCHHRSAS